MSAHAQEPARRDFERNSRVQAFYEGLWHLGKVVVCAHDNRAAGGEWVIQCDADVIGCYTSTPYVRFAAEIGARVQVEFEGEWLPAVVVALPDIHDGNAWVVQCDVDEPGCRTRAAEVRPCDLPYPAAARGDPTFGTPQAVGAPHALAPGAAGAAAAASGAATIGTAHASSVETVALGANGGSVQRADTGDLSYYTVLDAQGEELGTFGPDALEFELRSSKEEVASWLLSLPTELLPGLLQLLCDETSAQGKRMRDAEDRLGRALAPDDYRFFGLAVDCPDKDLERAYRRVAARLHPDKGGDAAAFDAMKKRFERLKAFRARGGIVGGPGSALNAGDGGADAAGAGAVEFAGEEGEARAAGSASFIVWTPDDTESMLQAHDELRLQLTYIAAKLKTLEAEVAEAEMRLFRVEYLEDGDDGRQQQTAPSASSSQPRSRGQTEEIGTCLICLENLPADPRLVVNPCSAVPQCRCLIHLRCFLCHGGMGHDLERCMICKAPIRPELVQQARLARGEDR